MTFMAYECYLFVSHKIFKYSYVMYDQQINKWEKIPFNIAWKVKQLISII